jgi:uncharacterized protein
MKIVLDTNVFVSGIFFGGPPAAILTAWQEGYVELVVSVEILQEYERVCSELAAASPGIDAGPFLALITLTALLVQSPLLATQICSDPDDDKFLACAIAAGVKHVISGDKQLLATTGYQGVQVIRPREFVDQYLK